MPWLLVILAAVSPARAAQPLPGATITQSTTLTADLDASAITTNAITIVGNNIRFDGGGRKIIAPNAAIVVRVLGIGVTVENLNVSHPTLAGTGIGVQLESPASVDCTVQRVNASGRKKGIRMLVRDRADSELLRAGHRYLNNTLTRCSGDAIANNSFFSGQGGEGDGNFFVNCRLQGFVVSGNDCSNASVFGINLDGCDNARVTTDNNLTGCGNGLKLSYNTAIENWDFTPFNITGTVIEVDGYPGGLGGCVLRNLNVSEPARSRLGIGVNLKNSSPTVVERVNASGREVGIRQECGKNTADNRFIANTLRDCAVGVYLFPKFNPDPIFKRGRCCDAGCNPGYSHRRYVVAGNDCSNSDTGMYLGNSSEFTITTTNVLNNCRTGLVCGARTPLRNWDLSQANITDSAIQVIDFFGEGRIELENLNVSRPQKDKVGIGIELSDALEPVVRNCKASGRRIGINVRSDVNRTYSFGVLSGNDVSECEAAGIRIGNGSSALYQLYTLAGNNATKCGLSVNLSGWGMLFTESTSFTITSSNTVAGSMNGITLPPFTALDGWGDNLKNCRNLAVSVSGDGCRITSANVSGELFPGSARFGKGIDAGISGGPPRKNLEIRDVIADARNIGIELYGNPITLSRSSMRNCAIGLYLQNVEVSVFHNNFGGNFSRSVRGDPGGTQLSAIPPGSTQRQGNYWGRSCPGALFVTGPATGADSDRADVTDSSPYGRANGWDLGDAPGCFGIINHPPDVQLSTPTPFATVFTRVLLNSTPRPATWTAIASRIAGRSAAGRPRCSSIVSSRPRRASLRRSRAPIAST